MAATPTGTCSAPTPRLPRKPTDGQVVCDTAGNTWQYEAATDSWIDRGTLEVPPVVTESQDGLVTPDVFDRLALLKSATNSGRSLPEELKIKPHTNVYWYLFHSSDKIIRFEPEGPSTLRLEVDRGRFYGLIRGSACRGEKGLKGIKGNRGADGPSLGPEPCFSPISVEEGGKRHNFDLIVPAPLDTDIVLRLGDISNPSVVIWMKPGSGPVVKSVADLYPLDQTRTLNSIKYDVATQRLTGAFFFSAPVGGICIYARQKGPTGDKGDPGLCYLQPREFAVNEADIRFTNPIIAMRLGAIPNQVLTTTANLFTRVCVSKLRLNVGSPSYGNIFSGSMMRGRALAVQRSLEPCKPFATFTPQLQVASRPALELPSWTPQPDCTVAKRAELSDLNWVPLTDVPSSTMWDNPQGVGSPRYPWEIVVPPPEDAGECDPCEGTSASDPPCPSNEPGSGGVSGGSGNNNAQYDLRMTPSGLGYNCNCVTSETPLQAGEQVLATYSNLESCQQAQQAYCPGGGDGGGVGVGNSYYQLRVNANDFAQNGTYSCRCAESTEPFNSGEQSVAEFPTSDQCADALNSASYCSNGRGGDGGGGGTPFQLRAMIANGVYTCRCAHSSVLLGVGEQVVSEYATSGQCAQALANANYCNSGGGGGGGDGDPANKRTLFVKSLVNGGRTCRCGPYQSAPEAGEYAYADYNTLAECEYIKPYICGYQ